MLAIINLRQTRQTSPKLLAVLGSEAMERVYQTFKSPELLCNSTLGKV
ncbi:MAG: hypothetical protein HWQ38_00120 [Nostoc sp. NMS7]|nr:hypothetical protein [Nostoc sp. NMS7]